MTTAAPPQAWHDDDVEVLDLDRAPMTVQQLARLMQWSFGDTGQQLAELWHGINLRLFDGRLLPVPIWLPRTTTYGRWIGLCTSNRRRQTLSLQVKYQLTPQAQADVLLHEMVHQALVESGQASGHNAWPWCQQIVRLTSDIWGHDIWAAPSVPRRVAGKSMRVQPNGPDGRPSLTRKQIATWPHSIGLRLPIDTYRERIHAD
jgi:hypothetical protein